MISCKYCNSYNIVKRGRQKSKISKQIYYCKECRKRFVITLRKNYDSEIILQAISYYNLGNTLEESKKLINMKFKTKVSKSAISNWLKDFKEIIPYNKLRKNILEKHGKEIIASKLFRHKGLTYNYKYHKGKLDFCKYNNLLNYLKNINENFPHEFFEKDQRCSKIKININSLNKIKTNYASNLAKLILTDTEGNNKRHNLIENFMLINDSCTIATEVPIWFYDKNIGGICGHIDILQIRFNKIHILDFKPEAEKENKQKVASQLYLYALGLSFRTGISLSEFRCAWFDADNYFEFEPDKIRIY